MGFIAYIHIIVLLFLTYMCAGGMVLCILMIVSEFRGKTGGEKDTPKNDEQEKDKKNDGEEGDNEEAKGDKVNDGGEGDNEEAKCKEKDSTFDDQFIPRLMYMMAIVTTQLIPFLTLVMVSGFLLYFTGDWKPLHDGFFNDLGFPRFNWPQFSFFDNPEYFFKVLGQFFTFNIQM